ncbi:hypothetical protein E9840_09740 [Tissierella creatinini]|nr:hypothetical protein E9840_09740 [Tissierella creatinini]TJX63883.1 hypothetical protein E8P77_13945 [Soehngenia saccharolytica]
MEEFKSKNYTNEQLAIDSVDSRFSKSQNRIRRYLMNYTINNGQAFNLKNLFTICNDIKDMTEEEIKDILDVLISKNGIVVDEEKNVNFIYPVSALATNHKVKLADGREFYAMCAIDAIGTSFTFKQDVDIDSQCSHCGTNVKISIRNGKIVKYEPLDLHILHVDLNKNSNWSGSC